MALGLSSGLAPARRWRVMPMPARVVWVWRYPPLLYMWLLTYHDGGGTLTAKRVERRHDERLAP